MYDERRQEIEAVLISLTDEERHAASVEADHAVQRSVAFNPCPRTGITVPVKPCHYGWTRGTRHDCIKWVGRGPYVEANPGSWWPVFTVEAVTVEEFANGCTLTTTETWSHSADVTAARWFESERDILTVDAVAPVPAAGIGPLGMAA